MFSTLLQRRIAWLIDDFCFAIINHRHRRHLLTKGFPPLLQEYINRWEGATSAEYFAVTADSMDAGLAALNAADPHARQVSFPSPLLSGSAHNDTAHCDLYLSSAGWTAPTMILAHGLMSISDLGYRHHAKRLNELGWNAIFVHLPYHYKRKSPGYWSGELAIGADLIRTVEGVRQSVQEMQVILSWLQEKGSSTLGYWGTSYGGWIGAVLGCQDSRLDRMILLEPVLNLEHAIWDSPATYALREDLARWGILRRTISGHMRLSCASRMELKVKSEHVLLLAGEFDRITPPAQVALLHKEWVGSHFYVFPQGHVGHHIMPASLKLAQELWPEDFGSTRR